MRLIRVVMINIKRHMKNPLILIMTILLPVVVLTGIFKSTDEVSFSGQIALINNDNSSYSTELRDELKEKYDTKDYTGRVEDKFDELRDNNIGAIYVIEEGFGNSIEKGEAPKIKVYKTEEAMGTILAENLIETFVNEKLEEGVNEGLSTSYVETIIKEERIEGNVDYIMVVMMICYFMMISGSVITEDLIKLRNQKVLKRTIATANSDREILGGLFLSIFIIQGAMSCIAFFITSKLIELRYYNLGATFFVIILCSLISTAIVACVTRWLKNPTLTSLATVIFGLICFGISMVDKNMDMFQNVPEIITRLSIVSPFTWMIRILNDNQYVVPTLVIIAMSLVFFTAGSFRLRDYAKE